MTLQWVRSGGAHDVVAHGVEPEARALEGHFAEICCGNETGSYLRLTDSCVTQLKAQAPSRTCTESKAEEEEVRRGEHMTLLLMALSPKPGPSGNSSTNFCTSWFWIFFRCCIRICSAMVKVFRRPLLPLYICSAMVGVPHRPLLTSLPTLMGNRRGL